MQAYTLYELNEYIRRVIALNFDEPIWIQAEISQFREVRGQGYLDLIQHEDNSESVIAQSSAVIWYKSYLFIKKKLGELLPAILKEGSHVLIKVKIDFNERYGLKLFIEDIDATYTIGQMELARQKIIQRLKSAGIMELNKSTNMPAVAQHIAVISSATAAGFVDFKKQMDNNPYGYAYKLTLYQAAMQGQNVEREVVGALREINEREDLDCVTIIRGGGSRLDLSFFDNFNIAHAITQMKIPVLTGIGHEIDESVADMVAYKALKTPTAVANYLLDKSLHFESDLTQMGNMLQKIAQQTINNQQLLLESLTQSLQYTPMEIIRSRYEMLVFIKQNLKQACQYKVTNENQKLDNITSLLQLSDPQNLLKKGFSILSKNNKIVTSISDLKAHDLVSIEMADGTTKAKIQ